MSSGPDEALAAHELDLVSRAAKGDAAAFDRFFERNAPAVQLLTERLLGPGEAADAVVIEAFEKTVRRLPLLGARNSSPALYVLSTARNGAYAALGRGRPKADGGPLAALLALPSRQRELLALRELGLAERDCAEVAGIDPSDVGPQVARARLRLTDELEGLSLSTVFADDRAERLLAAEVVRVEGHEVPGALAQEIASQADEDSRFAAALSAVRSPSRSVGQLPAVSGPTRLAAAARGKAVVGGAGAAGAAAAFGALSTPPVSAGPPAVPRTTSDPYDAEIGDEVAWGIVDDEDGFSDGPSAAGSPAVAQPTDGQWADGAGAVSEEPTQLSPATPAHGANPIAPVEPGAAPVDPADPFAGWDDALDWDEDEKEWAAGPGAAPQPPASPDLEKRNTAEALPTLEPNPIAAAAAGEPVVPREPVDLGETRAFDAVAAGLVDPDPIPVSDFDHGDEPPGRRSPWRWLAWVVAFVVLFAGVAFATYAYVEAKRDSDEPPASRLDDTTPASPTPTPKRTPAPKKTTGSSSKTSKSTPSAQTTSSSNGGSSSGTTGSSGASSSSGGSSGSSRTSSGGSSTGSGGSGTSTTTDDSSQVTSGESTSGGSVRGNTGGGAAGGTTP